MKMRRKDPRSFAEEGVHPHFWVKPLPHISFDKTIHFCYCAWQMGELTLGFRLDLVLVLGRSNSMDSARLSR